MIKNFQELASSKLKNCVVISFWIYDIVHLIIIITAFYNEMNIKIFVPFIITVAFLLSVAIITTINLTKKNFILYLASLILSILNCITVLELLIYLLVIYLGTSGKSAKVIFFGLLFFLFIIIIELVPTFILIFQFPYYKRLKDTQKEIDENFKDNEETIEN